MAGTTRAKQEQDFEDEIVHDVQTQEAPARIVGLDVDTMMEGRDVDSREDDEIEFGSFDLPDPKKTNVAVKTKNGRRKSATLVHKPLCPANSERVESFSAITRRGRSVITTRCQDCGEQTHTLTN